MNVVSDNHLINFANYKRVGLIDVGQTGWNEL